MKVMKLKKQIFLALGLILNFYAYAENKNFNSPYCNAIEKDSIAPPVYEKESDFYPDSIENEIKGFESGIFAELSAGIESGYLTPKGMGATEAQQLEKRQRLINNGQTQYINYPLRLLNKTSPAKCGMSGFSAGFHFGYDYRLLHFPLTIGVIAGFAFTNSRSAISLLQKIPTVLTSATIDRARARHMRYIDSCVRIGCPIGRANPFIKIGYGLNFYRLHFPTFQKGQGKWINSFIAGLGIDIMATRSILVGISSEVDIGAKKTYKFPTALDPIGELKISYTNFRTFGSIKYKIPTRRR